MNIGIDIVEIGEIKKSIEKYGIGFLRKVYTENEINLCKKKANKFLLFAMFFAIKEAAMKALTTGCSKGVNFKQIEINLNERRLPEVALYKNAKAEFSKLKNKKLFVSVSSTKTIAVAKVIIT